MVQTRAARAREGLIPAGRVVNSRTSTRARKSSKRQTGPVKRRAPTRRSKGSRPANAVPRVPAPIDQAVEIAAQHVRISNLQPSQQNHRHHSIKEHRECCPQDFPDIDLHQSFGSFLTRRNPISQTVDPDIAKYWDMLSKTPALLQHYIPDISERYRVAFKRFFGVDPISIHGHVSDAANPHLLTSLLKHLMAESSEHSGSENPNISFLSEEDRKVCRVAVTDRTYGSGYGPLAYNSVIPIVRPLACGETPTVINTRKPASIDRQVRLAKENGCVVLLAEIVRAADGTAIPGAAWKALLEACKQHRLVLVVDEAMTAIRCGAPFAHQLPQYQEFGLPDLILFGKGVRTNGIAIEWNGINMQKLGIDDQDTREVTMIAWQERYTEMATAADLLTSIGTLTMAAKEDWPQRAQKIGGVLRGIIKSEGIAKPSAVKGLHSLIYLRKKDYARISPPVMGAYAGDYVRWLPALDEVMMSEDELMAKIFGKSSLAHRKEAAEWYESMQLQPRWCSACGEPVGAEKEDVCIMCVARRCEECEPGPHVCPMEGLDD